MSKVLVVDDEPFILMMIEDKLKRAGYQVITSRSSRGIIDVVRKERPDLIILDWMMPGLSGIDVCTMLKSDSALSGIPVFMLTAKGQEDDEKAGLRCGVDRYITKPFSPKLLLEMVDELLGGKRNDTRRS
jgi:DNA-binding response OmpR family regulator